MDELINKRIRCIAMRLNALEDRMDACIKMSVIAIAVSIFSLVFAMVV